MGSWVDGCDGSATLRCFNDHTWEKRCGMLKPNIKKEAFGRRKATRECWEGEN